MDTGIDGTTVRSPIFRWFALALLVVVAGLVLAGSFVLGTLDDAMVRGGNAPTRRGLYWAFGAAFAMALLALIVLLAMIGARRMRARAE